MGGALRSVKEFVQGEIGNSKKSARNASFVGKDGRRYTWKVNRKSLALVRDDLPEDQPVAVYHREKRYMHVLRMSQHPYLEITSAAMDTLDSLIRAGGMGCDEQSQPANLFIAKFPPNFYS
ncbi:hypothetical protein NM688_g4144 [Phlebia brevispora]|uniref:Uncharacterized protein n=1 Tax=Phlebia brevispora TaxID=194682 RepID=A0ACC1T3R4_9APHY|nr:hypothetical protein NM688_g4144 [Phlebia brevispora]